MAITFTNILVGEGTIFVGPNEGAAVDIGATQEGVELAWEPDMVDIEVDQFGDAARVVQSMVKVSLKTKLAEGTLENLARVWNLDETDTAVLDTDTSGTPDTKTLNVGIWDVYPVERFVNVTGNAPGASATATRARTYRCNRAIQYSSSSHSLKRDENVSFPVDFRILPDPTAATGAEYGTIEDQIEDA